MYLRGVYFEEKVPDLAARSARLAIRFPHSSRLCKMRTSRRAVLSACSSVNYSPIRGPGKLPILFRAVVFLQRNPVYPELRARFRITFPATPMCPTLYRQVRNLKKMQLNARNTSTRGLLTNDHLQIISIATLASHVHYHTVAFMLTPCAPIFRRTCADGAASAIRHLVRSTRVRLLHAHSTVI